MLFAATGLTMAAYLESDHKVVDVPEPPPTPAPPPRIIRPIPPRPPVRDNELQRLLRQVDVGEPQHYRGLTVFPLELRSGGHASGIRSLDEALRNRWISIRELDRPTVSSVAIRNDSRHHVFLMAGEILLGGKQNRIVRNDVLLPPDSRYIDVDVYCGEKERWNTPITTYRSAPGVANDRLRKMAARESSQNRIWSEIDTQLSRSKVASPTRDYQQVYEDRDLKRRADECVSRFRRCWRSRTVGAVVLSGGVIQSCDVFADPSLFEKLRDKITRSWAVNMPEVRSDWRGRVAVPTKQAIHAFLREAQRSNLSSQHTPGVGALYRITGSVDGNALIRRGRVVHSALFPAGYPIYHR
ncbi:MAG: DUF6569 family protein [Verrucomicrobiota bacterium]